MADNVYTEAEESNIEAIAQAIKQKYSDRIYRQCSRLRVLGMPESRELKEIYTNINILEFPKQIKSSFNEKLNLLNHSDRFSNILGKIGDRLKRSTDDSSGSPDTSHAYLNRITPKSLLGIPAISKYSKLIIWGKVGSGKTTFLKYLALQCLSGNFQPDLVPILINLQEFAETSKYQNLSEFIIAEFLSYGVKDAASIQLLLDQGKLLILLDGLDAVSPEQMRVMIWQIKHLDQQFPRNHFLITCRLGGCQFNFEEFAEVEIANFNNEQITAFVNNWFKNGELARKFKDNLIDASPIQELASNPLILTFLCLLFETSNLSFNYLEVIESALELFIRKWDAQRNIKRDFGQFNLSLSHKLNLLSYIALVGFDQDKYLFRKLEHHIHTYFQNHGTAAHDNYIDPKELITLLESQHGLLTEKANNAYTFSYLVFQEYFTAKRIVNSVNPYAFTYLKERINFKSWHNVILLSAGILANADELVQAIKFQTDFLLAKHQKLQEFLTWIHDQTTYLKVSYHPAAIRAFYLDIDLNEFRVLDRARALDQVHQRTLNRIEARSTDTEMFSDVFGSMDYVMTGALNIDLALYVLDHPVLKLAAMLAPELKRSLQELKSQPPNPQKEPAEFKHWWNGHGMGWAKDFRSLIIQPRKGTQDWEFTVEEEALLRQYHELGVLLVGCLNAGTVSSVVRQEILETLFLPVC